MILEDELSARLAALIEIKSGCYKSSGEHRQSWLGWTRVLLTSLPLRPAVNFGIGMGLLEGTADSVSASLTTSKISKSLSHRRRLQVYRWTGCFLPGRDQDGVIGL